MPFREPTLSLRDILDGIDMIVQFVRGIGNWLRHRYDKVDVEMVWNTVIDDLPPLRAGVLRALTPPPANPKGSAPG